MAVASPAPLAGTTVYLAIPALAPHLPAECLAHPRDGDGYVVAVSFGAADAWVRGRFVRSRAFLREAKARRVVYRGRYGSRGLGGWAGPVRPKPALDGVAFWGRGRKRRVLAWGAGALPVALDGGSLVTRGPTALGSALSDAQELARERGCEIVAAPVRDGKVLVVCSVGKAAAGKVTGVFVTEIGDDYGVVERRARCEVPARCVVADFAVTEDFCVVLLHRQGGGGGGSAIKTLFGAKQDEEAPTVDVDYGSLFMLIPRGDAGGACTTVRIPSVLVARFLSAESDGLGKVCVRGVELVGSVGGDEAVRISTLADADSGMLWLESNDTSSKWQTKVRKVTISVPSGSSDKKEAAAASYETSIHPLQSALDVTPVSAAKAHDATAAGGTRAVGTVIDSPSGRFGLALFDDEYSAVESKWLVRDSGCIITGALLSEDKEYVSALVSRPGSGASAEVVVLRTKDIAAGPMHTITLDADEFGGALGACVGGIWVNEGYEWSEDGNKVAKSSYEIFDTKSWNDIDSSFSSLGLGQD